MRDLTSCISVCKEIPNSRSRIIRDFAGKAQGYLGICADVVFSLASVTTCPKVRLGGVAVLAGSFICGGGARKVLKSVQSAELAS